jgi:tellurite resistance protein
MLPVKTLAPHMKHSRVQVSEDNPFWALQNSASKLLADSLDFYRDQRDQNIELGVKLLYSDLMLGSFFSDKAKRKDELTGKKKEQTAEVKKKQSEDLARWRAQVNNGGYLEGIMRTIVLVARADHAVDRQEIIEACQILGNHSRAVRLEPKEYKRLITEQSLILEADRERAIKALTRLLRSKKQRREALDVAQRIADADGVFVDEERAVIHRLESVFKLEKSDSSRKRK